MNAFVAVDKIEEEYLLRILEDAARVTTLPHMFLLVQGLMQGVLPHEIMVCIKFSESGVVEHLECLRGTLCNARIISRLCDRNEGIAVRLALHFWNETRMPRALPMLDDRDNPVLSKIRAEMLECGLDNALLHGSGRISGGRTFFILFSFPLAPTERHQFCLGLLLPALHFCYSRVLANQESEPNLSRGRAPARLTNRELDVLKWISKGKTNAEIGMILSLSSMTIKNHVQNIFKKLDVSNRIQAASRYRDLNPTELLA